MSVWAILLAGGSSTRFGQRPQGLAAARASGPALIENKVLAPLQGTPVLGWSLQALSQTAAVEGVVIVAGSAVKKAMLPWLATLDPAFSKPLKWARPGSDRRGSVASGLRALGSVNPVTVLVHDGARPMAGQGLFVGILAQWAQQQQLTGGDSLVGLLAATPMVDTVKQCDPDTGQVMGTLPRQTLWQVQTPQVFNYERLCQAHEWVPQALDVTDDAQLLELARLGPVGLYESHRGNLKVTTPWDLTVLAAAAADRDPTTCQPACGPLFL